MVGCAAPNCSNNSRLGVYKFYRFPTDKERRNKWLINSRRKDWTPTANNRLCNVHFEESQFERNRADGIRKLKPNAIPTIFNVPNPPPGIESQRRSTCKEKMRPKSDIWDHFETTENEENTKVKAVCKYCKKEYLHAMASRLREHILNYCKPCPEPVKRAIDDQMTEIKRKRSAFEPYSMFSTAFIQDPSMTSATLIASTSSIQSTPSTSSTCLKKTPSLIPSTSMIQSTSSVSSPLPIGLSVYASTPENSSNDNELDELIARALYGSGVSLSFMESKYWEDVFLRVRPGYELPNRQALTGNLLDAEYSRVQTIAARKIQEAQSLSLICDGWTEMTGRNVWNFIITTPEPILFKTIGPGEQSAEYAALNIIDLMDDLGNQKFVALVTDNDKHMEASWDIVQQQFPHIACFGCMAHGLNLLIKDIMCLKPMNDLFHFCKNIVKLFKLNSASQAVFESKQKERYGTQSVALKYPSSTRWSSVLFCMDSVKRNKDIIQETVVCPLLELDETLKNSATAGETWKGIEEAVQILTPISEAIAKIEADDAALSDVQEMFQAISRDANAAAIKSTILTLVDEEAVQMMIQERRTFIFKKIHAAANLMDPRYKGVTLNSDEAGNGMDFIVELSKHLHLESGTVLANFAQFRAATGFFGRQSLWDAAKHVTPFTWWKGLCSGQPLCPVATRVLSVPPSSVACQKKWESRRRSNPVHNNRLALETIEKLQLVHWNLRFASPGSPNSDHEPSDDASSGEE